MFVTNKSSLVVVGIMVAICCDMIFVVPSVFSSIFHGVLSFFLSFNLMSIPGPERSI